MRPRSFALAVAASCLVNIAAGCTPQNAPAVERRAPTPVIDEALLARAVIVDVRTPQEHAADGHMQGDHNIPVDDLQGRLADVTALLGGDTTRPVVVYCRSGRRSARAKSVLDQAGFATVVDAGGYGDLAGKFPQRASR
jgi:phage shock protein E